MANSDNRKTGLLWIRLPPKVLTLLYEVERLYGKAVEAEFADISESPEGGDRAGTAIVTDDGRPTAYGTKGINALRAPT